MKLISLFVVLVSASAFANPFVGTWESACSADQELIDLTITEGQLTSNVRTFNDADCTDPALLVYVETDYTLGAAAANGATEINVTVKDISLTAQNAEMVDAFNDGQVCGHQDWQLGVAKSVIDCEMIGASTNVYSIIKVENDTLFLGDESDANDGETLSHATAFLALKGSLARTNFLQLRKPEGFRMFSS